ncbi:MAG TPA: hypothetical protein PK156_41940 [Polyangium sp.]|nr:hypothetical protein [Polyangium sp.]
MLLRTRRGLIEFGRAPHQTRQTIDLIVERIATSAGGLKYLRGALVDVSPEPIPEEISDDELLQQVAARLFDGSLSFVFLRPYDAPTPGFTVEGEGALVATDQKNKAGELKPAPEIPPEYPVLARQESDQVIDSTSKIVAALAKQLFLSFGRARRPSTIARTYVTTAKEQAQRILQARQTTDVSLEVAKWAGGGLARPKPEVPVEYKSAAKSTGQTAKVAIDKLAASLGPHEPSKSGRPAPEVPETLVQVASGTADRTNSAIASLGSSFVAMLHSTPFVRVRATPSPTDDGE